MKISLITSFILLLLWKTWDTIFPPVKEENIKGEWYAIIYVGKKGPHTFVARIQKKFRADSDGIVKQSNACA